MLGWPLWVEVAVFIKLPIAESQWKMLLEQVAYTVSLRRMTGEVWLDPKSPDMPLLALLALLQKAEVIGE